MPLEFQDYYETLGVSREATPDEIKKAYRKLARRYHPDNPSVVDREQAENKIKQINEAYEVLKDSEKRRKYDELGQHWDQAGYRDYAGTSAAGGPQFRNYRAGPGGGEFHFGGTGFSDFFEQFFGGQFDGGEREEYARGPRPRRQPFDRKGDDLEADLMISLEEAHRGANRPVSLRWTNPQTGLEETRQYKVRVPVGIREGQRLRLSGKGQHGVGTGGPGDLYLRVHIAPHPDYQVKGDDLYYELALTPWEAVLGTKVEIPTLDGKVRLTTKPGTADGKHLRVKGHGLHSKSKAARGDFYAVVRIAVPEKISAEERSLWEKLAKLSDFKPRE